MRLVPDNAPSLDRCANLVCPNLPRRDDFVLLETPTLVVNGERPIRLWVCAACAHAIRTLAQN